MAKKIYLYDTEYDCIGTGSCSLMNIQWQLEWANGEDLDVHISSVGGNAIQAVAIYNLLKKYEGKVTIYIDALAASAACTIAMAGSERIMSKYALLMIHKPSVDTGGTADDINGDVKMLDAIEANIVSILSDASGQSPEKITEMLAETTWLDAETALSLGFVTSIEDYSAEIKNAAIVSNYVKAAPKKLQLVVNKILIPETKNTVMDNKLIEATNAILNKVLNYFKKATNKITTDKGDRFVVGVLNIGSPVFNDADMDKAAEDEEDAPATDSAGNKVVLSIKDGKVSNVKNADDPDADKEDEEKDDDTEVDNKVVLNSHGIKVTNKIERKVVINAIAGKLKEVTNKTIEQDAIIVDLRSQLVLSHADNQKTLDQVKSEFTPEGSKRSDKAKTEAGVSNFLLPTTEIGKKAAALAVKNSVKK